MRGARKVFTLRQHHAPRAAGRARPYTTEELRPEDLVFSGIQPTGVPHLGNYLGALRQWVRIQNSSPLSTRLYFSIVDLHALTMLPCAEAIRSRKKETLAAILAIGLDPKRCTLFYQSDVRDFAPQPFAGCFRPADCLPRCPPILILCGF